MAYLTNARTRTLDARETALSAGKCADCKMRPRAINLDGSLGKRCDACKDKSSRRPFQTTGRPETTDRDEVEYSEAGYLDTVEFARYAVAVFKTIGKKPTTIGQIKERLGDKLNDHRLMDALSLLVSDGCVRLVRELPPMKWQRAEGR